MMVRKFNDNALEYVIFAARVGSILGVLAVFVTLAASVWTNDVRYLGLAAVAVVWAAGTGALGWWFFGNAEWSREKRT